MTHSTNLKQTTSANYIKLLYHNTNFTMLT